LIIFLWLFLVNNNYIDIPLHHLQPFLHGWKYDESKMHSHIMVLRMQILHQCWLCWCSMHTQSYCSACYRYQCSTPLLLLQVVDWLGWYRSLVFSLHVIDDIDLLWTPLINKCSSSVPHVLEVVGLYSYWNTIRCRSMIHASVILCTILRSTIVSTVHYVYHWLML